MTLAGKEEEVEKSEDRTESSGSSIEPGDLGSGAFDISKLITINLRTLNTTPTNPVFQSYILPFLEVLALDFCFTFLLCISFLIIVYGSFLFTS